jgi:CBS domain-containing protein
MKVKDILSAKGSRVWTVKAKATIHEALGSLVEHGIGALIVADDKGQVSGIVSERDIIRECYRNGRQIEQTPVEKIMSRNLIIGSPEDELDYIMGIMTQNRIRHVPVIVGGKLEGIISIGDIVKAQLHNTEYENHYLKDYLFGGR